jgi:hypothetical protein
MVLERNNFVIAGLGSSGTRFLAQVMDRSQRWHVVHEGISQTFDLGGGTAELAQLMLDARPRYFGDVNGALLFHLLELRVGTRAVIIRNPRDTLLSWYCDAQGRLPPSFFSFYTGGYFALDECIEQGIKCIRFERMVTDLDYLRRVIRYFGILDVEPTAEVLRTKVNPKRNAFCASFEAIDATTRQRFERVAGEFARKYYGTAPGPHADDFADAMDGRGELPLDEEPPPRKPVDLRVTAPLLAGLELPSRLLPRASIGPLAARLGLAAPDASDASQRLEEVRLFHRNLTLLVTGPAGRPQRILLQERREGAPYFVRTRHLHLSHLGPKLDDPLRETLTALADRLADVTLDDLWPSGE